MTNRKIYVPNHIFSAIQIMFQNERGKDQNACVKLATFEANRNGYLGDYDMDLSTGELVKIEGIDDKG